MTAAIGGAQLALLTTGAPHIRRILHDWRLAARLLRRMGGGEGLIHRLPPGASGWTQGRDMPAPAGKTFRELYRARNGGR